MKETTTPKQCVNETTTYPCRRTSELFAAVACGCVLVICCIASRFQACTFMHLARNWARQWLVSVTCSNSPGLHNTLILWGVMNSTWLLVPAFRRDWSEPPYWTEERLPAVLSWMYGVGVITCWPALMNLGLAILTVRSNMPTLFGWLKNRSMVHGFREVGLDLSP
jgi:hypothetical protein